MRFACFTTALLAVTIDSIKAIDLLNQKSSAVADGDIDDSYEQLAQMNSSDIVGQLGDFSWLA